MWHVVNQIIGKHKNKQSIIDYQTIEGIKYYNEIDINNAFGKYFACIGKKLMNQIDKPERDVMYYLQNIPKTERSLFIALTNKIEIKKLISTLHNKNSSSIDNISNNLLKKLSEALLTLLQILFNRSLLERTFPECMKMAEVIPLYKCKERDLLTNYRPISLLISVQSVREIVL